MAQIRLSDGEWKLMKTLWEKQPRTLAELVSALDKDTGWSRDLHELQKHRCQQNTSYCAQDPKYHRQGSG